ncbi:ethanolamine utilization microcompartment protein EutS [Halanaerobium sp. Z-7514]|uniref:Ethanolamine utilization microcompartment protein EutS n=1 Tax=Halanaerobium polyolivorans TaxID=2886943 RepID=A0AAW4WYS2_9FIRM|nr:ethanolamine utilization microcompartment protein EutS [Halanaerobium polyolivorans]MCC3144157.1 ethanolamine utilization microcompartment protein EutS [Halanaerobium polyolivorans]RQD77011.1 MAG: ethanolamine utilization microcompartment protein EutS [Halanaerobium sp. MSAO_Bac5]
MVKEKERVIQEYVPGKQVTMVHLIAHPTKGLYKKIGLNEEHEALGILTITPSEAAIIAADAASKNADVKIGFIDRFSGSLVISGKVSSVESALKNILNLLEHVLGFDVTKITRS